MLVGSSTIVEVIRLGPLWNEEEFNEIELRFDDRPLLLPCPLSEAVGLEGK